MRSERPRVGLRERMARNFKELQEEMDPASRSDNLQRVREELQRTPLDELRDARQLLQADYSTEE
jgi:hypothetical protein